MNWKTKFYWFNKFNGVEKDGPFKSIQAAKRHAVITYKRIQNGVALDIAIIKYSPQFPRGREVVRGSIHGGKWIKGRPRLTDTQKEVGDNYRRMPQPRRPS